LAQSPDIFEIDLGFANPPGKSFGTISFAELIDDDSQALAQLDESFLTFLAANPATALLATKLTANREAGSDEDSHLLVEVGKALEQFLILAFDLDAQTIRADLLEQSQLLKLKWKFVKRQGVLHHSLLSFEDFDYLSAEQALSLAMEDSGLKPAFTDHGGFTDASFGKTILHWQKSDDTQSLALAARYAAWAAQTIEGAIRYPDSVLFKVPGEHSESHWLQGFTKKHKVFKIKPILAHERFGFDLTEPPAERKQAHLQSLDQADYCLKCHKTKTDSCSKGRDAQHLGCPLHEKISEFMQLRSEGFTLGALAMIVRDNPMLAATGHRICNDCSQACVFQNQTPVDIPKAETQILREVLEWPLGFEIYALLTRWNPLNIKHWQTANEKHQSILIAGMGPAGFTLAHHLLQRGYHVAGIDALKIQALPKALAHKIDAGLPITNITQAFESLSNRPAYGFGGVAEYGITSRWEKNYLTVIRLLLLRRKRFREFGDIRLGSSLTAHPKYRGLQALWKTRYQGEPKPPAISLWRCIAQEPANSTPALTFKFVCLLL
jgi:hypothetical protein